MKYKLLLLLILCATSAFSQIQSQKGVLHTKDGRALSGTITYFYDSPKDIIYYDESGEKEVVGAATVSEIVLQNGMKFKAKTLRDNNDSTTIFLQSLIESPKISLLVKEEKAKHHFYVLKDNALHRLENNDVELRQNDKVYTRKDSKYTKTLSMLMPDRIDLIKGLNKVKLNRQELTKVILNYNQGDVSYFWDSGYKGIKEPNWVAFAQYSHFGSFQGDGTTAYSAGQMLGLQYYFDKSGRHSLKFSLEHSNYTTEWEEIEVTGLGFRYEFEFKQAQRYGAYFLLHIGEFGQVNHNREELRDYSELTFIPRFSPGIGAEIRPFPKIAFYGELNNLLHLKEGPKSFSFGLKYDFGATTR